MKTTALISLILICLGLNAHAQETFPYGKMLKMTHDELIAARFKYNKEHNQYVLSKSHGLTATVNVLNALNGASVDIRPHKNNYQVTIQEGETGVASISVIFYDDEIYHKIATFANDKGTNLLTTNSDKLEKLQFNYADYSFVLTSNLKEIKSTTGQTNSALVTKDESYTAYNFTILTDIEPSSDWLRKQAEKEQKRDAKGKKKQSANDLM